MLSVLSSTRMNVNMSTILNMQIHALTICIMRTGLHNPFSFPQTASSGGALPKIPPDPRNSIGPRPPLYNRHARWVAGKSVFISYCLTFLFGKYWASTPSLHPPRAHSCCEKFSMFFPVHTFVFDDTILSLDNPFSTIWVLTHSAARLRQRPCWHGCDCCSILA